MRVRLRGAVLFVLMSGLVAGCMSRSARESQRLEGRYSLGEPGQGWKSVSAGGADYAFRNDDLSATLYTDSNCGARYEDSPLPKLAASAIFGVAEGEPSFQDTGKLDGRTFYSLRQRGTLDGVPVELGVLVVKKDQCVYDMVVIAPPDGRFEGAWEAFQATAAGFRTRP